MQSQRGRAESKMHPLAPVVVLVKLAEQKTHAVCYQVEQGVRGRDETKMDTVAPFVVLVKLAERKRCVPPG